MHSRCSKGVATAVSKHAGFHLQAQTQAHAVHAGDTQRKSLDSQHDASTGFQIFTRGTELYLSGSVGPFHHIQADCCLEPNAAVVLSLTKTDLSIPSCG